MALWPGGIQAGRWFCWRVGPLPFPPLPFPSATVPGISYIMKPALLGALGGLLCTHQAVCSLSLGPAPAQTVSP